MWMGWFFRFAALERAEKKTAFPYWFSYSSPSPLADFTPLRCGMDILTYSSTSVSRIYIVLVFVVLIHLLTIDSSTRAAFDLLGYESTQHFLSSRGNRPFASSSLSSLNDHLSS